VGEYLLLLFSTIFVNNMVLSRFLGLCPFMGVSRKLDTAVGMGMATAFVLTLSSICSYLADKFLLQPFDLGFLKTITFILVIAVIVQFTEMVVRKTSPLLYNVLGIYLPLITTNCAVLGVAQVSEDDDVMLVTDGGKIIRMPVREIRISGRNTQGVRLIGMEENEHVASLARLAEKEE